MDFRKAGLKPDSNVVGLFARQHAQKLEPAGIMRLSIEVEEHQIVYSKPGIDRLFCLPVVAWAKLNDDSIEGLVAWRSNLIPASRLPIETTDWIGYLHPRLMRTKAEPPQEKVSELLTPSDLDYIEDDVRQEIPDLTGTHALIVGSNYDRVELVPVSYWQLLGNGSIHGLINTQNMGTGESLGDELEHKYRITNHYPGFVQYFNRSIAEKVQNRDEQTVSAIYHMVRDLDLKRPN